MVTNGEKVGKNICFGFLFLVSLPQRLKSLKFLRVVCQFNPKNCKIELEFFKLKKQSNLVCLLKLGMVSW